jgi:2'-5' RNA ligase
LLAIKKDIDALYPEWVKKDEKPFVPHITIKRWQRYEFEHLQKKISAHPLPLLQFQVTELVLFQAQKDNQNRKYHALLRHPLRG